MTSTTGDAVHITGIHSTLPPRRLDRADIARTWGRDDSGLVAVCGPDEDAITLATNAASALRTGASPAVADVDVVIFASGLPARAGGSAAAVVATALGLEHARTLDICGSQRCLTQALAVATDVVRSRSEAVVLVVCGDDRTVPENQATEATTAHAGVALVISATPGAARIVGHASVSDPSPDRWATSDGAMHTAGERFLAQAVYPDLLVRAAAEPDVAAAVSGGAGVHVSATTPRLASRLGAVIAPDAASPSEHLWALGHTGTAHPGILLSHAIANGTTGQAHLLVTLGGGVDVLAIEVGEPGRASHDDGAPNVPLPYGTRLLHTGRLASRPATPTSSTVVAWRDAGAVTGLLGMRCGACQVRSYPRRPVCPNCQDHRDLASVRMVGQGTVVTATTDHLVAGVNPGTPESPTTMAVVEMDDGGRLFLPTTHGTTSTVGDRVRTVLRVAHDGGGFRHHHWRVAPVDNQIEQEMS